MLGVKLLEVTPGCARVEMKLTGDMLNFHGIAHGGAIFSLADTAFAIASNSRGPAVALQVSINFTGAVRVGAVLTATAREEALTRKTGIYNIVVEDDRGETIALFRGVVYRVNQKSEAGR